MGIENMGEVRKHELMVPQGLGRAPYGESIRKINNLNPPPSHLHLVYIKADQSKLVIRHVAGNIDNTQLAQEEQRLLNLATNGNLKSHFEMIIFKEPSYFTIVLDIDGWDFYYPFPNDPNFSNAEVHDPIVFYDEKAIWVDDNGAPTRISNKYQENWSFYSLQSTSPKVNNAVKKGIRCINHYKGKDGMPPARNTVIDYGFNINLLVPFSNPKALKNIILTIDPDGQNQGPIG
jgi:hypothetical protein